MREPVSSDNLLALSQNGPGLPLPEVHNDEPPARVLLQDARQTGCRVCSGLAVIHVRVAQVPQRPRMAGRMPGKECLRA